MSAAASTRKAVPFALILALIVGLPWLGPGGVLAAAIVGLALLGVPIFVVIGMATVLCFFLFAGFEQLSSYLVLIERIRTLADNPTLLAIPLFIMSGALMSKGQISTRLVDFARALVGWVPGGLAMSAVIACMLFAAISGSSPATVFAIGGMMGPLLVEQGYRERFAHGLLTSAGSLGILIPPSIPMIIYPIVNQSAFIEVERLFASGVGPGLVMGAILMGFSFYTGLVDKAPRPPFALSELGTALRDGFWALMFPVLILGGIYTGFFNAVESAAISVVYAVIVEVWVHRAMRLRDVPRIFQETGVFLGALLVIMVAALSFSEFLELQGIPGKTVAWIESLDLQPWQFLVLLNITLIAVGFVMDILSAMFVFVPLLAPIAAAMNVDPIHFGIIFIVNLEIGYLTPPVGLNLFAASTLFERPIGHIIKSVAPFIALMLLGLGLITYVPELSVGLGDRIMGVDDEEEVESAPDTPSAPAEADEEPVAGGDEGGGKVMTMEEMMRAAAEGDGADAGAGSSAAVEDDGEVMTMEEMMEAAGVD
jgi:C4-dicarboxylate transporter DctM subunit